MPRSSKIRRERKRKTVVAYQELLQKKPLQSDVMARRIQEKSTSLNLPDNFKYGRLYHIIPGSFIAKSNKAEYDSVIGSGSFATCTIRVLSGLPVVIKQVYRETVKQRHVLQEAHLLQACCGHPNIVYLYGVCNPNCDRPMIVTALYTVSGKPQTLSDALPLTRRVELVQVLIKILEGLQFIHRKRILHNDIKCDNIVLTDTLPCDAPRDQKIWPIIIDFNKASPFNAAKQYNLSKKWRIKYKVKYTQLAPDLVDGAVRQSPSTDIYSFGALAKKVISASSAFLDADTSSKLQKISSECIVYNSANRPTIPCVLSSIKSALIIA